MSRTGHDSAVERRWADLWGPCRAPGLHDSSARRATDAVLKNGGTIMNRFRNRLLRAPVLALAAILFVSAVGPAAPARADDPIVRDHREIGRLEVEIKKVHIFDDRDWGEGEIRLRVTLLKLRECPESEQGGRGFCHDIVANGLINFGADSGETVVLNRIVPGPGDEVADASIGAGIGFPVSAGPGYLLGISGYVRQEVAVS
jgi:hypothetical protein